jgi:alkylhydroperoxidase family enzyme
LRALAIADEKIEAVGYWPAASCFTELERHVLAFTDCLVLDRGRVPDKLFAAIHDQLGDQATLELTYITSLYLQHAVMSRALRTEWDDVDERIVEVAGPDDGAAVGLNIALPQGDEH